MYAILIAITLGQLQVTQQIEPGEWMHKKKSSLMQIQMKEFGRYSRLKMITFRSSTAGKDISGRPYLGIRSLTGFYSVEKKGGDTLIHCRFSRETSIYENMGEHAKNSKNKKIDYFITFHTKLTKTGELEIYYTSDHVKNLVGMPVKKKYLFQKVKKKLVPKKPVSK